MTTVERPDFYNRRVKNELDFRRQSKAYGIARACYIHKSKIGIWCRVQVLLFVNVNARALGSF